MSRTFLIGVESRQSKSLWSVEESLAELAELAKTANLTVIGQLSQNREYPDPKSYLGKGKLAALQEAIQMQNIDSVIADDELSPAQHRHLEKQLNVKILDRTSLVLDIFASRAQTAEAQYQVELAQLNYLLPRLTRLWTHLSKLGGGIGTRGPGETQLEVDKRLIKTKIEKLKQALKKVSQHRDTMRKKRNALPTVTTAIVGYTNAGKSTLINRLTDAKVLSQDTLFATLDPTTRKLKLPNHDEIMISDTVGFIQKLSHHIFSLERFLLPLK